MSRSPSRLCFEPPSAAQRRPETPRFARAGIAASWFFYSALGCAARAAPEASTSPAAVPIAEPASKEESEEGAGLDALAVRRVVAAHQSELQSVCWLPALSQRSEEAARGARVFVSLEVDGDGKVVIVTPSDEPPGYVGLAGCVAEHVRAWPFPAAGAITRVNLPFVFREEPPTP